MKTTTPTRSHCTVYLHPAAASNPAAIKRIQQRTGLLVILNLNRAVIAPPPVPDAGDTPRGGDAA